MKNAKAPNPIIVALALLGVCALLYGGWTVYQHHISRQEEQAIRYGAPPAGISDLNKPSKQPPPQ